MFVFCSTCFSLRVHGATDGRARQSRNPASVVHAFFMLGSSQRLIIQIVVVRFALWSNCLACAPAYFCVRHILLSRSLCPWTFLDLCGSAFVLSCSSVCHLLLGRFGWRHQNNVLFELQSGSSTDRENTTHMSCTSSTSPCKCTDFCCSQGQSPRHIFVDNVQASLCAMRSRAWQKGAAKWFVFSFVAHFMHGAAAFLTQALTVATIGARGHTASKRQSVFLCGAEDGAHQPSTEG